MTIEPNKFYRTRSGLKARIYAVDGHGAYPIHGATIAENGAWVCREWRVNGTYSVETSQLDIVGEWTEPQPKLKAYLEPQAFRDSYVLIFSEHNLTNPLLIRAEWLDQP